MKIMYGKIGNGFPKSYAYDVQYAYPRTLKETNMSAEQRRKQAILAQLTMARQHANLALKSLQDILVVFASPDVTRDILAIRGIIDNLDEIIEYFQKEK